MVNGNGRVREATLLLRPVATAVDAARAAVSRGSPRRPRHSAGDSPCGREMIRGDGRRRGGERSQGERDTRRRTQETDTRKRGEQTDEENRRTIEDAVTGEAGSCGGGRSSRH